MQAEGCLHVSQEWREENCCRDSRGQHVECTELSYAEFGISTVSGKRHWVFKKTVSQRPQPERGMRVMPWLPLQQ